MFGLLCLSLATIISVADDPETLFNEADAPVSLAASVTAPINFVVQTGRPVAILRRQRIRWNSSTVVRGLMLQIARTSLSLLELLRKLLC